MAAATQNPSTVRRATPVTARHNSRFHARRRCSKRHGGSRSGSKVPYVRIYDMRSTYATRVSAGGATAEWVTQLLRQGDAKVFKKYSQTRLQMKRE